MNLDQNARQETLGCDYCGSFLSETPEDHVTEGGFTFCNENCKAEYFVELDQDAFDPPDI